MYILLNNNVLVELDSEQSKLNQTISQKHKYS